MPGDPEDDDEFPFCPVWETEDEAELEPPGHRHARRPATEPDYDHPLLTPLAHAQDAVARLEAKADMASDAVVEGLRMRLSYLEAAGWLRHAHVWIHPTDLALRDAGATASSYGVAAFGDRLAAVLPSTMVQEPELETAPSDIVTNQALSLARLWRRLAELRTWQPLADVSSLRETLLSLGCRVPEDAEIRDWLASVSLAERGPALIRAGRGARDWMNRPSVSSRNQDAFFLGACLWRDKTSNSLIPLPFWSAAEAYHDRLDRHVGLPWMADFLECVAAGAIVGLRELERLRQAEQKGRMLGSTARSRLPNAVEAVIRRPIVTASSLAEALRITSQAALGLLRQLIMAGIVRETTGRSSWKAYSISMP